MKTYTDSEVRSALLAYIGDMSYREAAAKLGEDFGYLYRMANGSAQISVRVAETLGFVRVKDPQVWMKKAVSK